MNRLRFTLISDGSSDKALIPVVHWLLRQYFPSTPIDGDRADFTHLKKPPKTLAEKIIYGCRLYPCDLLFVHRDAEREPHSKRVQEINNAASTAKERTPSQEFPKHVCVIPVRMLEAWLLFDIEGIRKAAANPNGKMALQLPRISDLESLPNPKDDLYELLRTASGLSGRRLKKFRPQPKVHQLSDYIDNYEPLRRLASFQALEREIISAHPNAVD